MPSPHPSTVVISFPSQRAASTTQLCTAMPSTRTVQQPQWLVSHPRLAPVRASRSRSTSSRSAVSGAST